MESKKIKDLAKEQSVYHIDRAIRQESSDADYDCKNAIVGIGTEASIETIRILEILKKKVENNEI